MKALLSLFDFFTGNDISREYALDMYELQVGDPGGFRVLGRLCGIELPVSSVGQEPCYICGHSRESLPAQVPCPECNGDISHWQRRLFGIKLWF